jgi:hypothetical protein
MSEDQAAKAAIASGLRYLSGVQTSEGEIPVFCAYSPGMDDRRRLDPCLFGAALIANLLAACPEASGICNRACDFIEAQREPRGLWAYYKKGHGRLATPPDVDTTSMSTSALVACGRKRPDNRIVLLDNLDPNGLFFTWIFPTRGISRFSLPVRLWRRLLNRLDRPRYRALLAETPWAPEDVSAGVNANVLTALGGFEDDHRLIEALLEILRTGREDSCDKYYDNPNLIRFFFSRALVSRCREARELLLRGVAEVPPDAPALDIALSILVRTIWDAPVSPDLTRQLVAAQDSSGAWPIAPLYCAGRQRLGYLRFAPTEPGWFRLGSEAITTAFCVSALHSAAQPQRS